MQFPRLQSFILAALSVLSLSQSGEGATVIKRVTVDNGVEVFYREAGPPTAPTVLLLHGYPASSHQFRHLIPILEDNKAPITLR